jgi:hypothetical protein
MVVAAQLPGVDGVALGVLTPWREGGTLGAGLQFTAEGYVRGTAKTIRAANSASYRPDFSPHSACQ